MSPEELIARGQRAWSATNQDGTLTDQSTVELLGGGGKILALTSQQEFIRWPGLSLEV